MLVQKIIQESINKNPLALKEALEEELRSRVALALEAKVAESNDNDDEDCDDDEDDDMKKESVELSELDRKTLASYIKKATDSHGFANRWVGRDNKDKDAKRDAANRAQGISRAVDRLTKEEVDLSDYTVEELEDFMMSEDFDQLDEISKKTLASYVKKAADDKADLTAWRSTNKLHNTDQNTLKKASRYLKNRNAGISKAVDRLAK